MKKINLKLKKIHINIKDMIILSLASIVFLFFGMLMGAYNMYTNNTYLFKDNNNEYLSAINDMYNTIVDEYYGEVSEEELKEAAIAGMFSILDKNTSYYDEGEAISFNNKLNGQFHGLGVEATSINEGIYIVNVIENGPAEQAGILPNDVITMFNGESLEGKTAQEFTSMVSKSSDECILSVLRGEETIEISVVLGNVVVKNVKGKIIDEESKIGYIDFELFSLNSASQFKEELEKLENNGMESLIIDLRDNSGGYLAQAKEIIEMFLKNGQVMYSIQSKTSKVTTKDETDENRDYKVVILVNESSASASEILSAALRENLGSILVGKQTYGKGSAQETSSLSNGEMIKMTTKKWLTPSGECIDGVGLTPDYIEELSSAYYENPSEETDNQLQKAISLLK